MNLIRKMMNIIFLVGISTLKNFAQEGAVTFGNVSPFLANYISQNPIKDKSIFLQNFPFSKYLEAVSFSDITTLQADRFFVYNQYGDGDEFLYLLGDTFLKIYPVNLNDLDKRIAIGEKYLDPKGLKPQVDEIYNTIGYFILSEVANKIEHEIQKESFDQYSNKNNQLIKRLENRKIFISIKEPNKSIKNKHEYFCIYTKMFGEFWWIYTLLILCFSCIVIGRFLCSRDIIFLFVGTSVMILILPIFFECSPKVISLSLTKKPDFKMTDEKKMFSLKNVNIVDIYKIKDNTTEIGQSVWLKRRKDGNNLAKASYLTNQNVYQKFSNLQSNSKIILATSGGCTNNLGKPEGFTVENGNIVNAVMMRDKYGLVMFSEGGIRVVNLNKEDFILPGTNSIIENPLNSLLSYSKLMTWCKKNKSTLFQTQLLVFSDSLLIDPTKAKPQQRERRILAIFSDKRTKDIDYALFNIVTPYNLAEVTQQVYNMIQYKNKKVEFIINIDNGNYNVLEVFDENGNSSNSIKGTLDIENAPDLILFSL